MPKKNAKSGGSGSQSVSPARSGGNGVWGSLAKGHEFSMRHGAYSDRKVSPVAEKFAETALDQVDYLADPSYAPALWAWARTEARIEILETWLDDNGMILDDGSVAGAANLLARFEAQAAKQRERLGMDPLSRAKIRQMTASTAIDIAQIMAAEGGTDDDEIGTD